MVLIHSYQSCVHVSTCLEEPFLLLWLEPETMAISLLVSLNLYEFTQIQCLDADTGFKLGWRKAAAGP